MLLVAREARAGRDAHTLTHLRPHAVVVLLDQHVAHDEVDPTKHDE